MRRGKRFNSKLGVLFFIIPILLIGSIVLYAFVQLNTPGTLIVSAESCLKGQNNPCNPLTVSATVDDKTGTTPWTLSLTQGNYVVNFTTIEWYHPASARDVSIVPGKTAYAVAVYDPIAKVVQVTSGGFNATEITALHNVTPVNWTNPSTSVVTFTGSPLGTISLEPGESLSYTFTASGVYNYTVLSTDYTLTVDVS